MTRRINIANLHFIDSTSQKLRILGAFTAQFDKDVTIDGVAYSANTLISSAGMKEVEFITPATSGYIDEDIQNINF